MMDETKLKAAGVVLPRRAQYIPTVQNFLPGCDGEELQMRCSLLLMRDHATATMRHCSGEAQTILQHVHDLAGAYVFVSMRLDTLNHLQWTLTKLVANASSIEMFAWKFAGGQEGENARG